MAQKAKEATASMKEIFPDWEVKERTYILNKKATPISFQLRSRHTDYRGLQWFDKKYGYPRSLRYVTNQTTFFEDEQHDNYRLGSVVFIDGKIVVSATNTTLQQFLALHPDNKENGGSVFYEYDASSAAIADLESKMKGFEAVGIALEMEIEDLEAVGRVIFHSKVDALTSGELKRDVVMWANNNPEKFVDIANNGNIRMRNLAAKAVQLGLIKIADDNSTVKWNSNGKEIVKLPFSNEPLETFAVWMKTDEGLEFVEALGTKLG